MQINPQNEPIRLVTVTLQQVPSYVQKLLQVISVTTSFQLPARPSISSARVAKGIDTNRHNIRLVHL